MEVLFYKAILLILSAVIGIVAFMFFWEKLIDFIITLVESWWYNRRKKE